MIIKAASGKKYRLASDYEKYSDNIKQAGTDKAFGYVGYYGSRTHHIVLDLITLPNNETVVRRMRSLCGADSKGEITLCDYDTAYVNCIRCTLQSW